nr:immunoglobulin light chain junction region [Macaca mulatta]MOX74460.1 immunoglobulin light chain junction region [Macaca mulatta]
DYHCLIWHNNANWVF